MTLPGVRLADVTASRENNFDVLRLAAAMAVLFAHCYPLTGSDSPDFHGVFGAVLTQGVPVFFAISGFLIARSWLADSRLVVYAGKRVLRLIPALVVAVGVTAFVVGPIFTALPTVDYLTDPTPYVYVLRCSVLITFAGTLPGVFVDNPYPDAVNGSLWTLPVEASAYAVVAILGVLTLLRGRGLAAIFVVALILGAPQAHLNDAVPIGENASGADAELVMRLLAIFLGGSLLYLHREHVRLSWALFGGLAVLWFVVSGTRWSPAVAPLAIPYLVIVLAYRSPAALRAIARPGDVSYGVYIYAFPIQQMLAATWGEIRPLEMFAVGAPAAYLAGLASWRLVERRALALKARLPDRAGLATAKT